MERNWTLFQVALRAKNNGDLSFYLTRLTPFLGALSSLDLQEFTAQGRDACVERVPWRPRLEAGFRAKTFARIFDFGIPI